MDHSLTVGETPTEDENGTIEGDTSSSSRIKVPDSDPVETFYNVDLNEDGVIDMAEVETLKFNAVIFFKRAQVNLQSVGLPGGLLAVVPGRGRVLKRAGKRQPKVGRGGGRGWGGVCQGPFKPGPVPLPCVELTIRQMA